MPHSIFAWSFAWRKALQVFVAAALLLPLAAWATTPVKTEHEVKAELILVFLDYIEWPESAFADADSPLVVGVLGDDPFGSLLDHTLADQQVQGRSMRLRRSRHAEDLKSSHLVFVSQSERNQLSEVLAVLDRGPVVTVSEIEGFCRRGGILNFYVEERKIRFEANPSAAQRKGIRLGAQLLKRATIVGPRP